MTALGNEKMKAEKAAEKGGKKSKAAKTKTSLVTTRANTDDMGTYGDDAFGEYVTPTPGKDDTEANNVCTVMTLCEAASEVVAKVSTLSPSSNPCHVDTGRSQMHNLQQAAGGAGRLSIPWPRRDLVHYSVHTPI